MRVSQRIMWNVSRAWVCGGVVMILLGVLAAGAVAQDSEGVFVFSDGTRIYTSDKAAQAYRESADKATLTESRSYYGITFNVNYESTDTYVDGSATGQLRMDTIFLACEYVAGVLNEDGGVVDIQLTSFSMDSGQLASAGPYFSILSSGGVSNGFVYEHIMDGTVDPSAGYPDMVLTINWHHSYNLGEASPDSGQYDLFSILVHEFTHGLGFLSLIEYPTGVGLGGYSPGTPDNYSVYDSYLRTGAGGLFINSNYLFVASEDALLGLDGGVQWVGPAAVAIAGSNLSIYAPSSWQAGSSISHWNFITAASVMNPSVSSGLMKRVYEPYEIAALKDLGYANAAELNTNPKVNFSSSAYDAGEGDGSVSISVSLEEAPAVGKTAQVSYATADGSATAGSDYEAASGLLTFDAGEAMKTFDVTLLEDEELDGEETILLSLSSPVDAQLGDTVAATLTITDNEVDSDGDSLTDAQELALGTDPNHADTDGDRISDWYEVTNGGTNSPDQYNPYHPVSNPSGTNTDVLNPDSDGDGVNDGDETFVGGDPRNGEITPSLPLAGNLSMVLLASLLTCMSLLVLVRRRNLS